MTFHRTIYYMRTLVRNILSLKGISAVLISFGALWLFVEIVDYFFKNPTLRSTIQGYWWIFFILGIVAALKICWPVLSVCAKLKDRDVTIEIAIGDLFSFDGGIVVGTNSTFDTRISLGLISKDSIQGQFTKRYYNGETQLDAELNTGLNVIKAEELHDRRTSKTKRYPIGTVVRLNPKDRTGYFLAIAHINEHGVALGTFEFLKQSLGQLWVFIGQRGLKEPVVMPVIGSGFTRLTQPRQAIVQEIIKSFIAGCTEKTLCDKLTIVLSENDVLKHQIDLSVLGQYLHHLCTYTEFAVNTGTREGTPVIDSVPLAFRIIKATYGTPSHLIDITNKLTSLVKNDRLSAVISNTLAGNDPHIGTIKNLTVEYEQNGVPHTKEFIEGSQLDLP